MTLEELRGRLRFAFEDDVGECAEPSHFEETAEGVLVCVTARGNPFGHTKTRTVSLTGAETKYRSLEAGEGEYEPGWKIVWQQTRESYGDFVDLPDEHEISAWVGPDARIQEGRALIARHFQATLQREISFDLSSITQKTGELEQPLSREQKAALFDRTAQIMRAIL